jgi:hypothetical protein
MNISEPLELIYNFDYSNEYLIMANIKIYKYTTESNKYKLVFVQETFSATSFKDIKINNDCTFINKFNHKNIKKEGYNYIYINTIIINFTLNDNILSPEQMYEIV